MSAAPLPGPRAAPGPVGRFWSFPIRLQSWWLLFAGVLAALFAVLYFRGGAVDSPVAAAVLGVVTVALLLGSVLVHELAHALVAARAGMTVSGITLTVFGGTTELTGEAPRPGVELRVALAGPLATLALAVFFLGIALGVPAAPPAAIAVADHLALINGLLLAFNLIPAVPLDGGRILRAALWALWQQPDAATRAVVATGRSFALLMIALGVLALVGGGGEASGAARLVFGAWFVLIGLHLRRASSEVTRQVWLQETLRSVTAAHLLDYRILSVQRSASGRELVAMDIPHSEVPVLDETRLVGAVRLDELRRGPASDWEQATAGSLMRTDILEKTLGPEDAAIRAVPLLTSGRRSVAVVDADELVGIITWQTLRKRLSLRGEA